MTRTLLALLALLVLLVGCAGGATVVRSGEPAPTFEPRAFLEAIAAEQTDLLRAPERSIEALMAAREGTSGEERRGIFRDLARAHAALARSSDGREAHRQRERADRFAEQAGARDAHIEAEMDFLALWMDWESDARNVAARAERFTRRHDDAGALLALVWMIRGELALQAGEWQPARDAFRFVLGSLGHPLYGYALYRTALAWHSEGDEAQTRQALEEAAALGCPDDASAPTSRIALLAARQLGVEERAEGGRSVPASCPESSAPEAEGWRPPE